LVKQDRESRNPINRGKFNFINQMKKLKLTLDANRELSKDQMKKIAGGYGSAYCAPGPPCFSNDDCNFFGPLWYCSSPGGQQGLCCIDN